MKSFMFCLLLLILPSLAQAAGCQPLAMTGKAAALVPAWSTAYQKTQLAACAQQANPSAPATVTVVSSGFPKLSGAYGIDSAAIVNITATVAGIAAGQGFPGGATAMTWIDSSGNARTFETTAEFIAFGTAIRNYVYALQMAAHGQAVTIPATPLQIP